LAEGAKGSNLPQVSEKFTLAHRLAQKALAILGFSKPDGRDADVEQAFLRVAVTAIVLVYGTIAGLVEQEFSPELRIALVCGVVTGTAGIWMLYRFRRDPARPAAMRSFGIAADLIPITAGLFWAGEIGVPLVGLYLWITVGNGFRFGPRYLLQAYALSGVCFFVLLFFAPFWQLHRAIGIGLAILLGTIPLYVLVLLSRLTAQKNYRTRKVALWPMSVTNSGRL
jgi:two-component system sensor histidine kinase RpfC